MSRPVLIGGGLAAALLVVAAVLTFSPGAPPSGPPAASGTATSVREPPSSLPAVREPEIPPVPPGETRAERARRRLLEGLRDAGREVDLAGLREMARTEAGVTELLRLLSDSRDVRVRALIVLVLGESAGDRAFGAVEEAARGDLGDEIRTAGILALGQVKHEGAVARLAELASGEPDPRYRSAALQALVERDSPEAVRALADLLACAPVPADQGRIWMAIGGEAFQEIPSEPEEIARVRRSRSPPLVPVPEAREAFREMLDRAVAARDPGIAMAAGSAPLRMPGEETRRAFLRIWERAEEPVRDALLGRVDPSVSPDKFREIVSRAADFEREDQRARVAEMLSLATEKDLLPALRAWLRKEKVAAIRERLEEAIRRLAG